MFETAAQLLLAVVVGAAEEGLVEGGAGRQGVLDEVGPELRGNRAPLLPSWLEGRCGTEVVDAAPQLICVGLVKDGLAPMHRARCCLSDEAAAPPPPLWAVAGGAGTRLPARRYM